MRFIFTALLLTALSTNAFAAGEQKKLDKICKDMRTDISFMLSKAKNKDYRLYNNTLIKAKMKADLYHAFKCSPVKLKEIYDKSTSLQYDIPKDVSAFNR